MAPASKTQFRRDAPAKGPLVRGFTSDGFSVGGETYRALLLTPEGAQGWEAPSLAELSVDDLAPVLALDPAPEFVILGTGATTAFAPRAFVDALAARGIGVEAMDSRAAARTWGLLRAEERWIAAAIMPL